MEALVVVEVLLVADILELAVVVQILELVAVADAVAPVAVMIVPSLEVDVSGLALVFAVLEFPAYKKPKR